MCMDDASVSNQPHCLTVVFLSACFYVSGDVFGFTFGQLYAAFFSCQEQLSGSFLRQQRTTRRYIVGRGKKKPVLYEKRLTK